MSQGYLGHNSQKEQKKKDKKNIINEDYACSSQC